MSNAANNVNSDLKLGMRVTYHETYNGSVLTRTGTIINTNYLGRVVLSVKGFQGCLDCRPCDIVKVHASRDLGKQASDGTRQKVLLNG